MLLKTGRLRLFIGVFVLLVVWIGLFAGFYRAFIFLQTFMGVGEILIDRLIYLLTFALFIMLIFSNAVISFQLNLKAAESVYLHTLPLPRATIFRFLLLEGTVLSTWATFFLIFPVALAYGLSHGISLFAFLSLLLFAGGLSFLAALLGALIAALIPPLLTPGKGRRAILAAVCIVALTFPLWRSLSLAPRTAPNRQTLMLNRLLEHSRITLNPLLPGYWAAEGFIQAGRGRVGRSLGFLAVLAVNTLFVWQIVELTAERYYYKNWSLYRSRGGRKKKCLKCLKFVVPKVIAPPGARLETSPTIHLPKTSLLFQPGEAKTSNFRHFLQKTSPVRALLIKDTKVFFRDPAQWIQAAILFGLLAIYIVNIKNMPRNVYQTFWKNLITFFNLGATSLILATLSTRFIYPSFSLEGRTFWVLGLAPIRCADIFRIKFWSHFIAAVIVTLPLMLLSNHILEVSRTMTVITGGAIVLMAGVLVSLANGLGAIFPQFTEDNPSRIASGFGGTLNLILSLIYIVVVVCTLAIAYHLQSGNIKIWSLPIPLFAIIFILIISILGSWLPFRLGIRAMNRMEF